MALWLTPQVATSLGLGLGEAIQVSKDLGRPQLLSQALWQGAGWEGEQPALDPISIQNSSTIGSSLAAPPQHCPLPTPCCFCVVIVFAF